MATGILEGGFTAAEMSKGGASRLDRIRRRTPKRRREVGEKDCSCEDVPAATEHVHLEAETLFPLPLAGRRLWTEPPAHG